MTKQVDYEYYEWLTSQIHIPIGKTYEGLFELMHNTLFVWTVPNDHNRGADGTDLRYEFLTDRTSTLDLMGPTVLEVLVALSRRLAFISGGNPETWAWRLIKNLDLHKMSDFLSEENENIIREKLDNLLWRRYPRNGMGGFFPLKNPTIDQTTVEIWYQMNTYALEMQDS